MKSKLLIGGAVLIVLLLLVTPSISAIKYRIISEENQIKLKELKDANNNFIDIAVLLTILNVLIARLLNGFPMNIRGIISTLQVLIYAASLLMLVKTEYTSGMSLTRYKAYQGYFASLFSIVTIIEAKLLSNKPLKMPMLLASYFIFYLLAQYLGNILYVALGRPG